MMAVPRFAKRPPRTIMVLLVAYACLSVGSTVTQAQEEARIPIPPTVNSRLSEVPEGFVRAEGDMFVPQGLAKGTVWEPRLWPGGTVPYEFVENNATDAFWYSGTTFSFKANPPTIVTTDPQRDFRQTAYRVGQLLHVTGSASNDNGANSLYTIIAISSSKLLLDPADSIVDEAAGNDVRVAVSASVPPAFQSLMLQAMAEWEQISNLDFVPRAGEANYVEISSSLYNQAMVGMRQSPGRNTVEIFSWGNRWIMCHELAHALGERHEQSRPDRGTFVTINDAAISQTACGGNPCDSNFEPTTTGSVYPATPWVSIYDFDSVMHYGQYAFSICPPSAVPEVCADSLTTIDCNPGYEQFQSVIGQRDHLSFWDKTTMSYLYADPAWVFLHAQDPSTTNSGSFWNPRTNFDAALSAVPSFGKLVILYPDTYAVAPTGSRVFTKQMVFEAPTGGVLLQ